MKMNQPMVRFLLPLAAVGLLLAGCTSPREVYVDALAAPEAGSQRQFVLVSDMEEVQESDLFFKEVRRRVEKILQDAGFSPGGEAAPIEIGLEAFLSEPMVQSQTRSEPIYARTRGTSHIVATPIVNSDGKVVRFAYTSVWSPPRTEIAGYVDQERQVTVHDKVLRLKARDRSSGEEVWTVSARLRSPSTDFRAALPYLLLAARPYIAERTEGEVVIRIRPDSEELQSLRDRFAHGG